ncbi:unnamed protein product, partial [Polarella glacialis]
DDDAPPQEGTVWVCTSGDQIPEEAKPLPGILRCSGAEESEIRMDGRFMGPILLRPSAASLASEPRCCLLSQVTFEGLPASTDHGSGDGLADGHRLRDDRPPTNW